MLTRNIRVLIAHAPRCCILADPREDGEVQAGGAQERPFGNDGRVGRPDPNGDDRPRVPLHVLILLARCSRLALLMRKDLIVTGGGRTVD